MDRRSDSVPFLRSRKISRLGEPVPEPPEPDGGILRSQRDDAMTTTATTLTTCNKDHAAAIRKVVREICKGSESSVSMGRASVAGTVTDLRVRETDALRALEEVKRDYERSCRGSRED